MGKHDGFVTTQALQLSNHFRNAGFAVTAASTSRNRYLRLLDIMMTLIRRGRRIDILVVDVYGGPSFVVEDAASWLGSHLGHVVILLLHGGALPEFMASHPRWSSRVLRRADAIVAPSPYLARAAAERGFPCSVIPNVITLSDYPYRRRRQLRPRLLWMRTFHPVYNPFLAVRVLARVRAVHPGASLVMAGQDKGLQEAARRLAGALGLHDAVRFAGFLDQGGKAREGESADVFLNTNHIDNMPVSVVEACAMGLPVVSTDVGGVRDLLKDGETGLLVPDDDETAMTQAVLRLLDDQTLAERLSSQGRLLAESSAWEKVLPRWAALFDAVTVEGIAVIEEQR